MLIPVVLLAATLAAPAAASPSPPGSPPTGTAALWEVLGHFDEYPAAVPYQVADQMKVGSATLRMAGFTTADSPAKVLAFYRAEFVREKLILPPGPPPGDIPYEGLTGFDLHAKLQKTVMVMDGGGGPTRVILSVSPEAGLDEETLTSASKVPAGLPVFPKSSDVFRTDGEDGPRWSSTISYQASGKPAEVLDYIRKGLSEKGWAQAPAADTLPGQGLRYLRSGESVDIMLRPLDLGSTEVTYLYVH